MFSGGSPNLEAVSFGMLHAYMGCNSGFTFMAIEIMETSKFTMMMRRLS